MITALLTGFAASPWMRAMLRYGTTTLAVLLFLLALRRFGERTGRPLRSRFRAQLGAGGATWLNRQAVVRDPSRSRKAVRRGGPSGDGNTR